MIAKQMKALQTLYFFVFVYCPLVNFDCQGLTRNYFEHHTWRTVDMIVQAQGKYCPSSMLVETGVQKYILRMVNVIVISIYSSIVSLLIM